MISLISVVVLLIIGGFAYLMLAPTFGAKPTKESLARMKLSEHFVDGKFVNNEETQVDTRQPGESLEIAGYIFPDKDKNPQSPLPSVQFDKTTFKEGDLVWFGHSSVMLRSEQSNILIDPVFHRASPVPIGGKPFAMTVEPAVSDLPAIDVILISHDHYDHLDHVTIGKLAATAKLFLVPLGNQGHLLRWGVPAENIIEMDWFESHRVGGNTFTLTPSRHFSGRGITNRFSTLWGSWVIESSHLSVFYGGDSGYTEDFKRIGERFGPFDIAFIENGAYDRSWAQIHMMPEQSVQAALDLNATLFFPIHWGKFDLAKHRWTDPIERAVKAANAKNIPIVAPIVGQVFQLESPPFETWWNIP